MPSKTLPMERESIVKIDLTNKDAIRILSTTSEGGSLNVHHICISVLTSKELVIPATISIGILKPEYNDIVSSFVLPSGLNKSGLYTMIFPDAVAQRVAVGADVYMNIITAAIADEFTIQIDTYGGYDS